MQADSAVGIGELVIAAPGQQVGELLLDWSALAVDHRVGQPHEPIGLEEHFQLSLFVLAVERRRQPIPGIQFGQVMTKQVVLAQPGHGILGLLQPLLVGQRLEAGGGKQVVPHAVVRSHAVDMLHIFFHRVVEGAVDRVGATVGVEQDDGGQLPYEESLDEIAILRGILELIETCLGARQIDDHQHEPTFGEATELGGRQQILGHVHRRLRPVGAGEHHENVLAPLLGDALGRFQRLRPTREPDGTAGGSPRIGRGGRRRVGRRSWR